MEIWVLFLNLVPRSPMRRCRSLRDSLNIVKHHETLVKHCKTSWSIQTLAVRCDDIGARCSDISARLIVSGTITNCSVGITSRMSNRVTNPWDMGIFSRPVCKEGFYPLYTTDPMLIIYPLNLKGTWLVWGWGGGFIPYHPHLCH